MPVKKLLHLLTRPEISEVALQSGRPPCAMLNGEYRRITSEALDEDAIIALLASAGGRAHLISLADGTTWDFDATVGTVRVTAGYEGAALKASMRLIAPAKRADTPDEPAPPPQAPAPAPTAKPAVQATAPTMIAKPAAPAAAAKVAKVPQPSAAAAVSREPALAASLEPDPDRSFDDLVRDAEVVRHDGAADDHTDDSNVEKVATIITTADHAFNFEAANIWSRPPPPADDVKGAANPVPAAQRARGTAKFVGDLLDDLFGRARDLRASDVHVVACRPPMFRVAGELVPEGDVINEDDAAKLVLARVPANLRAELDKDGSCDFSLVHPAYGRFRVNVSRQRTGYKLTARLIGESIPTLADLGLPASIARAVQHHQGLIVVTGPTGHGKTTTLAAIVGIINRETTHHVITVEDPVEYVHPTARAVISQREVGRHTKSFQAALKGSLREDPDVIVVGELRDTETVRMALTASETGHLVISTMNTPNAAKAIERLIELFPPGDQPQVRMTLAGGLRLIISQRLVPSVDRTRLHVAAEVLPGVVPLWNMIRDNRMYQIQSLQQRGKSMGITRLDESLAELVRAGKIAMDVARMTAEAPEHLEALVAGRAIPQPATESGADAGAARPAGSTTVAAKRAEKPGAKPGAKPATAAGAAAGTVNKGAELGKSMLSRAGKLFGNDSK
jgi:twitching motility protein PilT